jgi:hypothetical protein
MMFMITFRSRLEEKKQETNTKLDTAISALGPKSSGFFDGVWILQSSLNAANLRDLLRANLEPGDRIFVARISQNWAGINMGDKFPDWLKGREFGGFIAPTQPTPES